MIIFVVIFYGSDSLFLREVYGRRLGFTGFNREHYGHGTQSFLLCVLSIAPSVVFVPIASYSVASSLCAALPVALTIVHFDGTFILSLHNIVIIKLPRRT